MTPRRPPPLAVGAALIVVAAVLVGVLVNAGREKGAVTGTYTAPAGPNASSPSSGAVPMERRTTGLIPVTGAELQRVAFALYGGDPDRPADDQVVLVTVDGTEVGRGPLNGWYTNYPDRGVDVQPETGGWVVTEGPIVDGRIPGCDAVHGAGGLRAAVCGPFQQANEIRVVESDGSSRVLTGPANGFGGHWRWALPSPDGRWVLAQWSGECEVPVAYLIDARSGSTRPVVGGGAESMGVGWATDGRAVVGLWPGYCGDAGDEPGTYLIDPASGARHRIHPYYQGALVTP